MTLAMADFNIVDPSRVYQVLDDEVTPPDVPIDDRFITIRLPSAIWDQGEVCTGDNSASFLSKLMITGQSRHTLWLSSQADLYGNAETLLQDATSKGPAGGQYLGQMVAAFFEQELVDENGNALTNKPMRFISYELPEGPSTDAWKPFRITWEVCFTWDLSSGG